MSARIGSRVLAVRNAVDEAQDVGQVDALRVGNACAVAVGDVRVHREDGVRTAQYVGTAGIAEAKAAFASTGIGRQLDEFNTLYVVALNQQAGREISREKKNCFRGAPAADESLHAITDDVDLRVHGQRVDEARCGELRELPGISRRAQGDDSDVV